jgi:hypothetical protein
MKILARHDLFDAMLDSVGEELLLEGSWPTGDRRTGRWSLDEAIDARHAWIDRVAVEYAQRAAAPSSWHRQSVNFPYINALALRYYFVKLLRVLVFFRDVRPLASGEPIELHLSAKRDEPYADLFHQMTQRSGGSLEIHWHEPPVQVESRSRRSVSWRRWAARARPGPRSARDDAAPRVVLCGNPRILNPICAELVSRGCRVWWLYERFAVRNWWRWRAAGVEQLVCDASGTTPRSFSDIHAEGDLRFEQIDLGPPVERWLGQLATHLGSTQSRLIERVGEHFRTVEPDSLVLDEDATPLKRIAAALARRHGARSTVIQHGAPCGSLGFMPLAADEICVWGESSRRQFEAWGMRGEKVRVTGWPCFKRQLLSIEPTARRDKAGRKRFLLLATVPPRDERPDNIEFHLTTENHAAMFDMVFRVLSRIKDASLVVKLHPRTHAAEFNPWPSLMRGRSSDERNELRSPCSVRVVQSGNLAALIAESDCVLSCASTAGIEAALAGAPVVQILPAGSGEILPATDWGFVGSARTAEELEALVATALDRGWRQNAVGNGQVLAEHGRTAASRVVDGLVGVGPASYATNHRFLHTKLDDSKCPMYPRLK